MAICSMCVGAGTIECPTCDGKGRMVSVTPEETEESYCPGCYGGPNIDCPNCGGLGEQ